MTSFDFSPSRSIDLPLSAVQAMLDAVPGHVAVVDERGGIRAVNRAWIQFMLENGGNSTTCGVGANYLRVCDGAGGSNVDDGTRVAAGLRGVLDGTLARFDLEYPCHSPTRQRWYVVHVTPFRDGGDGYALVMHEDVTIRKLAEIREADLDVEIAERVQTRTKKLRDENSELDAFIGAVSHDMRAPVRHVRSFVGKLRSKVEPRLSEDEARLFDIIESATMRLNSMIDELLGLARVSQKALDFQEVNLAQVVLRAWQHMAPETEGRAIEWIAGDLPVVRGDPELLRLVFENLLSNAVKYTSGRDRAKIEVGAVHAEDEWVVFVQDDGAGFDMKFVGRLFGAFQRLHTEREFSGIGMGLANVKRIVERHGGRVWARSHPGDGATFYLAFPKR
ncbi:PAS domain-containing sensor histidine kinase [Deinococcus yavapaiensis]|uniref:histidine kinase n=1 Tax=Deinococcus yavapaiensis KR-236 TaxID=694435 RepID=A0A318S8I2_9DEIO|nr:ATP-binding protein [Deinococcus yavapaiensis]PYE53343.1 PAS domain-containing protein [Deinococcus yavapaiensis KR-236]